MVQGCFRDDENNQAKKKKNTYLNTKQQNRSEDRAILRTSIVASEVCANNGGVAAHGRVDSASRGPGEIVVEQGVDEGRVRHLHVERAPPRRTVACPALPAGF